MAQQRFLNLYIPDWVTDMTGTSVMMRGFWISVLARMHTDHVYEYAQEVAVWCGRFGITVEQFDAIVGENRRYDVFDYRLVQLPDDCGKSTPVIKCNHSPTDVVIITCRRLRNASKRREQVRNAVNRHREKGACNQAGNQKVSNGTTLSSTTSVVQSISANAEREALPAVIIPGPEATDDDLPRGAQATPEPRPLCTLDQALVLARNIRPDELTDWDAIARDWYLSMEKYGWMSANGRPIARWQAGLEGYMRTVLRDRPEQFRLVNFSICQKCWRPSERCECEPGESQITVERVPARLRSDADRMDYLLHNLTAETGP